MQFPLKKTFKSKQIHLFSKATVSYNILPYFVKNMWLSVGFSDKSFIDTIFLKRHASTANWKTCVKMNEAKKYQEE